MANQGPSRRALLKGALATSALPALGSLVVSTSAFAEPNWKKYAGTTIEANLIKARVASCCRNTPLSSRR